MRHRARVQRHFSEVPLLLRRLERPLVLAACSPPDRHGYVSLGTNADYVAPFIGQVPFFVEANAAMPRTTGRNSLHLTQLAGWCEADRPLVEVPPAVGGKGLEQLVALVTPTVRRYLFGDLPLDAVPARAGRRTSHRSESS